MSLRFRFSVCVLLLPLWLLDTPRATAQWLTQSFSLKQGWNAVYLHVDLTHTTVRNLIDVNANPETPIEEIWLWTPVPGTAQFTTSPQTPSDTGTQWSQWKKSAASLSPLQLLPGNSACLVKVNADTDWTVKGRPVPPREIWTSSGLNFIGLPVPDSGHPTFAAFLTQSGVLNEYTIYRYPAGSSDPVPGTPIQALSTETMQRGEAMWMTTEDEFSGYFAPFKIELPSSDGVFFGDSVSQARIRIRNVTPVDLTVTLSLIDSESPPDLPEGVPALPSVVGPPPLLLRGALNTTDLTYAYSSLTTNLPGTFSLKPKGQAGSEAEIVLGLNRSAMTNETGGPLAAGGLFAAVLRFTDSLNHSQVDVPVSATVNSTAGLWVGEAQVSQVRHSLKSYATGGDGALATSSTGQYIVAGVDNSLGSVSRPASLRLILHNLADGAGAVLLQRVYYGIKPGGEKAVATQQHLLDPLQLKTARRISAVHLPWTRDNAPWPLTGQFLLNSSLTATVSLPYDDQASNPFLHTYHPDHDNLNADFSGKVAQGEESYQVTRTITLTQRPPGTDFNSLTAGGARVGGDYFETLTMNGRGSESRTFQVQGTFSLGRVSDIATLTKP